MTLPSCHICGTSSPKLLTKDGYELFRCPECLLVFVYPQPQSDFLAQKVYSAESGYQGNKSKDLSILQPDRKSKKVLNYIIQFPGRRLLDVGSSNGQFLYWAKQRGFAVQGVELNQRNASIAISNDIPVFTGFLSDATFKAKSFDIIFLGDVIEHVNDPKSLLLECYRLLGDQGILIISTPNLDCLWAKITWLWYNWFAIPWSAVTPPHHLFQFSGKNLNRLAYTSGFLFQTSWFFRPPRLAYELGSLHLYGRLKKDPNIVNFLYMIFAFALYIFSYMIDYLITPCKSSDFGLVYVYRKKS